MQFLKQSTAVTFQFGPFVDVGDGVTPETGLATNMDNATTGIRISKNGATMIDRNSATAPAHDDDGYYRIELSTTDTNTLGTLLVQYEEVATCLPMWREFMVVPANVWDSLFGADTLQVDVTQWLGTAVATPTTAGVPEVDVTFVSGTAQTANDNGADINTLLTRIVGTLAAGTHNAQTGDAYAIVNNGTYGNAQLVRSTTPANTLDIEVGGCAGVDFSNINGTLDAAELGADCITAAKIADNAFSNEHFAAGALTSAEITSAAGCAVTSLAAGIIDNTSVGTLDNTNFSFVDGNERVDVGSVLGTAQTAGDLAALITTVDTVVDNLNLGIIYGTAQTGTLSTTQCTTNLQGTYADDELIGRVIIFTGGTALGQASRITDYADTNGLITFDPITTVPVNNDAFKIV